MGTGSNKSTGATGALGRSLSYSLGTNIANAALLFLTILYLARFDGAAAVGRFSLALAIVTPMVMLLSMRLRFIVATDIDGKFAFRDYLLLRLLALSLVALVVFVLQFSPWFEAPVYHLVVAVFIAKTGESISELFYGRLQREDRMDLIFRAVSIKSLLVLLLFVSTHQWYSSLNYAVFAYAFGWLCGTVYDYFLYRNTIVKNQPELLVYRPRIGDLLLLAWPLGLVAFLNSTTAQVPLYFIQWQLGEEQVGYYAILAQFLSLGVKVFSAVGNSFMPRMARQLADEDADGFKRLLRLGNRYSLLAGLPAFIIVAIAGDILLRVVFGPAYAVLDRLLLLTVIAATFNHMALLARYALNAMHQFAVQARIYLLDLLVTTVLVYMLINSWQLYGVLFAIIIARFARYLITSLVLRGLIKVRIGEQAA